MLGGADLGGQGGFVAVGGAPDAQSRAAAPQRPSSRSLLPHGPSPRAAPAPIAGRGLDKAIDVPRTNLAISSIYGRGRGVRVGSRLPNAGKQRLARGRNHPARQMAQTGILHGRVRPCCSRRVTGRAQAERPARRLSSAAAAARRIRQTDKEQERQGRRTRQPAGQRRPEEVVDRRRMRAELGITDQQSAAVEQVWQKSLPLLREPASGWTSSKTRCPQMIAKDGADEAAVTRRSTSRGRPRRGEQGAHADDLPHEQDADGRTSARRSRRWSRPCASATPPRRRRALIPVSTRFIFISNLVEDFVKKNVVVTAAAAADRSSDRRAAALAQTPRPLRRRAVPPARPAAGRAVRDGRHPRGPVDRGSGGPRAREEHRHRASRASRRG